MSTGEIVCRVKVVHGDVHADADAWAEAEKLGANRDTWEMTSRDVRETDLMPSPDVVRIYTFRQGRNNE